MTTVNQLKRQVRDNGLGRVVNVSGSSVAPGMVVAFAVLSMAGLAVAMTRYSYDVWAAFWIAPVLMLICVPIANSAARAEGDVSVGRFILGAAALKIIGGAFARFVTLNAAYDGNGDSERYDQAAKLLAPAFRSLDFSGAGKISGTRFIEVLTGAIYAVVGASEVGGFLIYSFLAFLGMYWFYRAFVIAFPTGDRVRYRYLLFLFPTMWFWPSSIGKDAWMVCMLGLATLGLAKALSGRTRGLVLVGLGLWGTTVVRPHMTAIFLVAAGVAVIAQFLMSGDRLRDLDSTTTSVTRRRLVSLLLAVIIVVAALVSLDQIQQRFDLDTLDVESAESVLTEAERRSSQGGSQFDSASPSTPLGFVTSTVTVLFRPFPIEAQNVQTFLTSMEGVFLALLMYFDASRLLRLPKSTRYPYILFALVWTLAFVYAFASIENFGILARQRVQLFPALFVVLAMGTPRVPTEP